VGAAGDRQHESGHEALAGQEQHRVGDVLRPLDAATARRLAGSVLSAGR